MARRYTFRRSQHLRRRRDFESVFATRCSAADSHMVVYVHPNGLALTRLGLSVGKGVGRAVQRSRIKRLIRESFRLSQHEIPTGLDIVCVAKPIETASIEAYRASLLRLVVIAAKKLKRRSACTAFEESE